MSSLPEPERLKWLRQQLKAREGNPAMARAREAIRERIAEIEASLARVEAEAAKPKRTKKGAA